MKADAWTRIKQVVGEALDLPPERREAYVAETCADAPDIREAALRMLQVQDEEPAFLETPAGGLMPPTLPERIGPYRILEVLGQGGMGIVYRAERADGQFEQQAAIKLIRDATHDPVRLQQFRSERQILASLNHPHIARLYDGGILPPETTAPQGIPYLVMEYVAGQPIDAYCDARRLSLDERIRLFLSVCHAVQYAHRNLVVHRDLKPSNILITVGDETSPDGTPKLLDFGIAKLLDPMGASALTQDGHRALTPEYASPEQIRGTSITTATDVYALGVILYRLLTGHPPYIIDGQTPAALERTICDAPVPNPSTAVRRKTEKTVAEARRSSPAQLAKHLQGDLDNIVQKALHKDLAQRYTTPADLAADLQRYRTKQPVSAHPPTLRYRARKFIARNTLAVFLTGLALLAVLLGAGAVYIQSIQAQAERDRANRALAYVTNLFEILDPEQAGNADLSVLDVLGAGVARTRNDFADAPEEYAQLMTLLGNLYHNLGFYDQAIELHTEALTRCTGTDQIESLNHLAGAHQAQGAYPMADSLYQVAHALAQNHLENPAMATALHGRGQVAYETGRLNEAERYLRDALQIRTNQLPPTDPDVLQTQVALATVLQDRGELDEAEQLYRATITMQEQALGPDHLHTSATLNGLAALLYEKRAFGEADTLFQRSINIARHRLGSNHPEVALRLNNHAMLLARSSRFDEAEPLLREALQIYRERLGNEHQTVAGVLNNLGGLLRRKGDLDAAEPYYREAITLNRALFTDPHPHLASSLRNLAILFYRKGQPDVALPYATEAVDLFDQVLPETHALRANAYRTLGLIQFDRAQWAEAEAALRTCLEIRETNRPVGNPGIGQVQSELGEVLLAAGQFEAAEPLLKTGYETLNAAAHPDAQAARARLDRLLDQINR